MIRKPVKVCFRLSQLEADEIKALWKESGCWDMTTFMRKAVAQYRRFLLEQRDRINRTNEEAAAAPRKKIYGKNLVRGKAVKQ